MQSFDAEAEPLPLSTRATPRKQWSAPPPPMAPPKRSLLSITLIGAVWIAVGAASVAYVVTRSPDARPAVATTDVER